MRDATWVSLEHPLFLRQVSRELGGVLEDEHKSYIVDVGEQLPDGWAALHRPGLQSPRRGGTEQVEQAGVVPVPAIQYSFQEGLPWCVRHIHAPLAGTKAERRARPFRPLPPAVV